MFTAATADCPDVGQNLASLRGHSRATSNRRFEFKKRSHLLVCPHNETLAVATIMVSPVYSITADVACSI
jgi:hypothetical protein